MTAKLCVLPVKPRAGQLLSAYSILERTCDSAAAFINAFSTARKNRGARGTPTDHEQDLLRAALVFAAAGLDSMVKQLVRDALQKVISKDKGAKAQFTDFVQSRLRRQEQVDLRFLAEAICAGDPTIHLQEELKRELTGFSLQSKDQLLRAAAYFAIPADEIGEDMNRLKTVFEARNQIAHEMDIQLGQRNRGRRQRKYDTMRAHTILVLTTAVAFYTAVAKRL
ncbi:MAG: HEPN domain-containing protein [Planctomycetota bacterium]